MDMLFFIIFLLSLPVIAFFVIKLIVASVKKDKVQRDKQLRFTGITSVAMLVSLVLFLVLAPPTTTVEPKIIETSAPVVNNEPEAEVKPELTEEEKAEAKKKADEEKAAAELKVKQDAEAKAKEDSIPREHKSALKKAESYAETMHMSKVGIYEQLTSEYGENFPPEAAQYAIDNIEFDWKESALKKAQVYAETMSMSDSAIYDQLISEYGEKFTAEEAKYAIDNLDK